jgi:hypothetical protein
LEEIAMTQTTDDTYTATGDVVTPEADSDKRGGIMMFINSAGNLTVYDAETGEQFRDDPNIGEHHHTEVVYNANGEPELYDTSGGERRLMVEHKKMGKPYREPVGLSERHIDARVIYMWTYKGSSCNCVVVLNRHVRR